MTVEEAIEQLKNLPPKAELLRGDNSGGYEQVREIKLETVMIVIASNEKIQAVVLD